MSTSQNSSDLVELEPEVSYSTSSCTGGNTNLCKEKDFLQISRRTSSTTKNTDTISEEDIFNLSDVSEFILD